MAGKYFGTDGIRGRANTSPINALGALHVGMAVGFEIIRLGGEPRAVIGKDTRLSGYMLENAVVAGLTSMGVNALQVGPVPTPAVALLTRTLRADIGIMISASHNAYHDNGIKFFDSSGHKITDELEGRLETLIDAAAAGELPPAEAARIGRAKRIEAGTRYAEFCKATCARDLRLNGVRIVVDTANGAGYNVIPEVLWELGAEVISIGNKPNGFNINQGCGSTEPQSLCDKVRELRADIGFAVDGDADRIIIADERGQVIDGDQILALIASEARAAQTLRGGGVVGTIMSSFRLERWASDNGLRLERADVGDRFVMRKMVECGINVGGEPSGHVILSDYSTTGDALITMLQVLNHYVLKNKPASESVRMFTPMPQKTMNVARRRNVFALGEKTAMHIDSLRQELGSRGRLVVRASGTEPVFRLMVEAEDEQLATNTLQRAAELLDNPNDTQAVPT